MALTQQLSPAGLSLLQLFMPTLTPLSLCHLKYPLLSWVPFHRDYTIWRKWINHQGVSKAYERVNSQGFPAFRWRPLPGWLQGGCTGLWKQKLVFASPPTVCWDSAKDTIFFLRRSTAVRSCTSQIWRQENNQIWQKMKWEQDSNNERLHKHNQFGITWVASIKLLWSPLWGNQPHMKVTSLHNVWLFVKLYICTLFLEKEVGSEEMFAAEKEGKCQGEGGRLGKKDRLWHKCSRLV